MERLAAFCSVGPRQLDAARAVVPTRKAHGTAGSAPGRRNPHGRRASFQGREQDVLLVSATNGEGSHPHSSQWPERRLRHQRPLESRHALQLLGLDLNRLDWRRLNLKDGALPHDEAFLVNHLNQLLKPGDLLLTTWRGDGHCDHEAAGRACAQAAQARRVQLAEAPVWAWHWASPDDPRLPWPGLTACSCAMSIWRSSAKPSPPMPASYSPMVIAHRLCQNSCRLACCNRSN